MRGVRRLSGIWRGASFSLKFAAVILVAGVTIAVVPLMLAEASARTQAESSAADRVSVASNLIAGQRASLASFIAGVGRQLAADRDVSVTSAVRATLTEDASVIGTDDVLGVLQTGGGVVAVQGSTPVAGALTDTVVRAVSVGATTVATPEGGAWMVAASRIPGTAAMAFVARPLTAAFINTVAHNIDTATAPVGKGRIDVCSRRRAHTGRGHALLRSAGRMAIDTAAARRDPRGDAVHRGGRAD